MHARRRRRRRPRRGIFKVVFIFFGVGVLLLAGVLAFNTLRFTNDVEPVVPAMDIRVDVDSVAARLAEAVRFRTISHADGAQVDSSAFLDLHAFLEGAFPGVDSMLVVEKVSDLSLLYTWPGHNTALAPVVLMGHQDVVPVEGREEAWTQPPFDGVIRDGFIWGRGTLDNKSGVLGILEAVELLLAQGFAPERTVYLAFGHDEEVGGERGAKKIAEHLAARHASLAMVLDEGGLIIDGVLPGLDAPTAIVGTAEKGYLSLELSVESAGGHSSRPPRNTAIGILSEAITTLEAHPLPARLHGPTAEMFAHVGPSMVLTQRVVLANLWLFRPLMVRMLGDDENTSPTVRTTTAATLFNAGEKDNVLPTRATAVVNFRILPGETVESVTAYVRQTIDDPRVQVRSLAEGRNPSPVSPSTSAAFEMVAQSIRAVSPEADLIVAPYLSIGGTDAKHFTGLSDNVYRFIGWKVGPDDLDRVHGINERLAIEEYARSIRFYAQVLRSTNTTIFEE